MNPIRSTGGVIGGRVTDMSQYFAVRNQPGILAAKLVYSTVAAILE